MTKILITGVGGYIGSIAAYLFLQKGYEVVAVDNFSKGYRQPFKFLHDKFGKEKFRWYEVDIQKNDLPEVFNKEKDIQAVVHYAAFCSVDESMKKPEIYFENNLWATLNLLKMMDTAGIKNIIFSSTCAVYGEAQYVPVDEKHPTIPSNPYGESKLMAEKIIEWFGRLKQFNYVILRYFNVCGASDDGLIGDSKHPSSLLVQNAVRGALGIEPFYLTYQEYEVNPDNSPIRDYINVVDLNEAHLRAVEYLAQGGKNEIINLGTGVGNSVLEVVETVKKITGKSLDVKKGEARQGEYAKMIASIDKAKTILHWEPNRTIEDSIRSLVKWYSSYPHGWLE